MHEASALRSLKNTAMYFYKNASTFIHSNIVLHDISFDFEVKYDQDIEKMSNQEAFILNVRICHLNDALPPPPLWLFIAFY